MRYFFKLDENDVILDAKESLDTIYQWTEVPEFPFIVWTSMMGNPDSLVNTRRGIPQYINGAVGVFLPHPSNGLTPNPFNGKESPMPHTVTEIDQFGNKILERELSPEELLMHGVNPLNKRTGSIIIPNNTQSGNT